MTGPSELPDGAEHIELSEEELRAVLTCQEAMRQPSEKTAVTEEELQHAVAVLQRFRQKMPERYRRLLSDEAVTSSC